MDPIQTLLVSMPWILMFHFKKLTLILYDNGVCTKHATKNFVFKNTF